MLGSTSADAGKPARKAGKARMSNRFIYRQRLGPFSLIQGQQALENPEGSAVPSGRTAPKQATVAVMRSRPAWRRMIQRDELIAQRLWLQNELDNVGAG